LKEVFERKDKPAGLDVASHYVTLKGPSQRFQDFKTANPDSAEFEICFNSKFEMMESGYTF
jgi:hypothetical protein